MRRSTIICSLLTGILSIAAGHSADIAALNQQGVDAYNRGDFAAAITLLSKAFDGAPDNSSIAANYSSACCARAGQLAKNGDTNGAITILRTGRVRVPQNATLNNNLSVLLVNKGSELYNAKDFTTARQFADEALLLDDRNAATLCLAGDIAYGLHDLPTARSNWLRAQQADPSNTVIAHRLEKLQREQGAEQKFSQAKAGHFDIRFDYRTLGSNVFDIRDFLMEAYNRVGQDLDRYPSYPVTVILYDEAEFRLVNNVPQFVAGLYDGKIRVPINFTRYPLATLKGILFHEYTHALIYDLAGTLCPIWLNEGIAMREMNTQLPVPAGALHQALAANETIPLNQLSNRALWNDAARVSLAYSQSWIMAEYLFYRWSNSDITKMLGRFKQGDTFSTMLKQEMNRTPQQFEEEWKRFAAEKVN